MALVEDCREKGQFMTEKEGQLGSSLNFLPAAVRVFSWAEGTPLLCPVSLRGHNQGLLLLFLFSFKNISLS